MHLPILHYHAPTSAISELTTPQVPIAMFSDRTFVSSCLVCEAGDLLVILTDGLMEVFDRSDQEFGLERLKGSIQERGAAPLQTIEESVFRAVRAHGAQLDDQTLLLIRATA